MWERLIAFAALTGMRRGEICALRWTDIHADVIVVARSLVKIKGETHEGTTKTHQVRRIALDPLANGLLTAQLNYYRESAVKADVVPRADGYVFFGFPDGSISLHPDSLSAAFKRISIRAGVENLHFHSLRHFSATQLIAAGVDVRTVANRLGHADPSMTLRVYSHALEQKDKDAASILGGIIGKK
jgi:integrase